MPHAWTYPQQPDPIHAAIARHRAAYEAFQTAPEGKASLLANDEYDAATEALVATACATRFGALAFLEHLHWWLGEEAEFAAGHQPGYRLAQARAADLTLFLGTNLPPVVIGRALPSGRMVPPPADLERIGLPFNRALAASAEALAGIAIIAGGAVLTGLATLI